MFQKIQPKKIPSRGGTFAIVAVTDARPEPDARIQSLERRLHQAEAEMRQAEAERDYQKNVVVKWVEMERDAWKRLATEEPRAAVTAPSPP